MESSSWRRTQKAAQARDDRSTRRLALSASSASRHVHFAPSTLSPSPTKLRNSLKLTPRRRKRSTTPITNQPMARNQNQSLMNLESKIQEIHEQ
jgi:hypothetical protein